MSQSLDRALTLLTELSVGQRTLDQLADAVDVHKSTVLRLLRTLEARRFVQRADPRHYQLGSALFDLANRALEDRDVRRTVAPALRRLNDATGHTVHLASYESGEAVYIDKYDGRHAVRMYSRVGRRAPLHCTAVAKVLLAGLPDAELDAAVRSHDFLRLTEHTITDPATYRAELAAVRIRGYALDRAEHEDFIHCAAAPVRGPGGAVLAAVSVSVPTVLLGPDGIAAVVPALLAAAAEASAECGWVVIGPPEPTGAG